MLTFILANRRFVVWGILSFVIAIGYTSMKIALNSAKSEAQKLRADIALITAEKDGLLMINENWRQAYENLGMLTNQCNESIKQYEIKSKQAQKKSAEALKKAELISKHTLDSLNKANARIELTGTCSQAVIDAKAEL